MPCVVVLEGATGGVHVEAWLRSVARWASVVKKNVKLWLGMAARMVPHAIDPASF